MVRRASIAPPSTPLRGVALPTTLSRRSTVDTRLRRSTPAAVFLTSSISNKRSCSSNHTNDAVWHDHHLLRRAAFEKAHDLRQRESRLLDLSRRGVARHIECPAQL